MATYTRERFYHKVLQNLGQNDSQEPVGAKERATVRDATQQMFEFLYDDGLIQFDVDTDQIPARYFIPLTWKVAFSLMGEFSATDRKDILADQDARADVQLNRLTQRGYLPTPTQATYY